MPFDQQLKTLKNILKVSASPASYFDEYGFHRFIKDVTNSRWLLNFLLICPFYLLIIIHSSKLAIEAPVQEFSGYYIGSCKTTVSSGGRGSPNKTTHLFITGTGVNFKFNLNEQPFLCNTTITHFSIVTDAAIYFNQQRYILSATYRNDDSYKTQNVTRSIEEINKNEIDSFNLLMTVSYIVLFLIFAIGMYFLPAKKSAID